MKKRAGLPSTVVRPSLLGLLVVALVMLLVVRTELLQALTLNWSYVVLAALLGAISGASELISRYRDEPVHAATSLAGVFYMALNALVSACAYGLLTQYSKAILPGLADDALMRSLVAGFGAMALLRSKFFTVRTEQGEDVPIDPSSLAVEDQDSHLSLSFGGPGWCLIAPSRLKRAQDWRLSHSARRFRISCSWRRISAAIEGSSRFSSSPRNIASLSLIWSSK